MRITEFTVQNVRGLSLAACSNVPRLMIIAGPNGAGKSTLLYELRNIRGRSNILYVGPHRSSRRQDFDQRDLYGAKLSFEDLLCSDNSPTYDRYQGLNLSGGRARDPWNADESASYLKFTLCQIELERQQAIASCYDRLGHIPQGTLPDPWQPLKDLTNSLLPHLQFARIDNSNPKDVRCLWCVHSKETEIDLDDLSSGEKAVIQMFYPLLEHQIRSILTEISSGSKKAQRAETCVLIDEPELHLHPNLQMKVFDYLRIITNSGTTQVITISHSPTIVEHANFEELFLLRPIELLPEGSNQLIQIANDDDKLKLLRNVFGTTSNVTALQPIVIVEGVTQTGASATISDRKLYRALSRDFDAVTVIPGGGKSECLKLLGILNSLIPDLSKNLKAVALLDSDTSETAQADGTHLLPVSMIENFLLDPVPLWEAIQSVSEKAGFSSIEEVTSALNTVLTDFEASERIRRSKSTLGTYFFRPESPLNEIKEQAEVAAQNLLKRYSSEAVSASLLQAEQKVAELTSQNKRREKFHGKDVIDAFYQKHLSKTGLPKNVFKFEAARHARERKAVKQFFESFFNVLLEKHKAENQKAAEPTKK